MKCSSSNICCRSVTDVDNRGPAIGNATKTGVYRAMTKVLENEFRFFKMHHNTFTIVTFLAEACTARRRARLQAFGAYFALHTLSTNRGPPRTSFALPLAMLLTPEEFIRLPLAYIGTFDAQAAHQLEPWVLLPKNGAFPKMPNARNSPHHAAVINLLLELNINVRDPRQPGTLAAELSHSGRFH